VRFVGWLRSAYSGWRCCHGRCGCCSWLVPSCPVLRAGCLVVRDPLDWDSGACNLFVVPRAQADGVGGDLACIRAANALVMTASRLLTKRPSTLLRCSMHLRSRNSTLS
jgi:hypothetical protein